MNYFIHWFDGDFYADIYDNYYVSHRVMPRGGIEMTATKRIGRATVFRSEEEAGAVADALNETTYMGALRIRAYTDKELFIKRLEGK